MDYNKELIVADLETPEKCFLGSFYIRETGEYKDFLINKWENQLFELVKFLEENKDKYFVWYNGLKFDGQVIEYIIRNIEKLSKLSNLEISKSISEFASDEIDKSNFNNRNTYDEDKMSFKHIDLPSIWHFFNENRRVSLKQLEFELRAEEIEQHDFTELDKDYTKEEIYGKDGLIYYCHNDIKYTNVHLEYTIGNTNHILYRGEDKIADRLDIMEEVGLPCLNWDDVRIGADWNKKDYMEDKKIDDDRKLQPKVQNKAFGKPFKKFFPKTMNIKYDKNLKIFLNTVGNTFITRPKKNKKQEFKYKFNKELTCTMASGGLHSNEGPRFLEPLEDELYFQCDIGGQYPNAINKLKIEPKHLPGWNSMIQKKIEKRTFHKNRYKMDKNRKDNSIQKMLKLSLNGGSLK